MMQRARSGALALVIAALVLSAGCGGGEDETATTATTEAATTTTHPAEPPCYGLAEVDILPEWIGSLAFGEAHNIGTGSSLDLRGMVGCEVDGGVLVVTEAGVFEDAYMENCVDFEGTDIPMEELRPPTDKFWACIQPAGDGLLYVPRYADS